MLKIKRGIQLLILTVLVSVNWQLRAHTDAPDACQDNGPRWCCENYVCPIHEDLCRMSGGVTSCVWDGSSCSMMPCLYP